MSIRDSITFPENKKSEYETESDLMIAIKLSLLGTNLDIAKSLLENYGNINSEDEEGRTILINSLLMDSTYLNKEIIKYIIEQGANVNKLSNQFINVMDKIYQQDTITEGLIKYVNDCIDKRNSRYVPLIMATDKNYVDVATLLLEKGSKIDEKNDNDETMLSVACRYKRIELIELALKYKANVNTDNCPLYTAILTRNVTSVKLLLDSGANIISNKHKDLFEIATYMNNFEIIELFFKKGAKIEMLNEKGFYTLRSAIDRNNIEIVELLLDNGVDVNQKVEGYMKPLTRALSHSKNDSHEKIIRLIILKGAEYDLNNALGTISPDNILITKLLKGEPKDLLNKAIQSKNINMIKILVKKEDNSEETLIEIIKLNNQDLVKFYFENVKPLTTLNHVLEKIMNEVLDYDILKLISENLK